MFPTRVEWITMFPCRFSLFCVVAILCIYICVGSSHIKKCTETDKQALLRLKDGFIDEEDILSSWNGEDCCKWKGISCDNLTGHVISLDLPFSGYFTKGKIDSSICELRHLTSLNLSGNQLNGKIPKCIGSLGQLIELKLAINELVSVIPPTLGNLSNLQTLDLGFNNLVANDLEWLSHLSNLRFLDLSYLNLSRAVDWLPSISKLPSIMQLYFRYCGLPQVNHKSIPYLNSSNSLKILYLPGNNLNSSILSWVLNFSKVLTDLSLSDNSLHSIPDSFANMNSLQYLDLSYNSLHSIPDSFANMNSLRYLDLSDNSLHSIPDSFANMNSLPYLYLSNNSLHSIPDSFANMNSLRYLGLSYNSLHSIPDSFANMNSLQYLDLSNNELEEGSIPKSFQSLCQLKMLGLDSNKLSGQLSDFRRHLCGAQNSFESLDLSNNPFSSGPLPDFSWLSSLKTLSLRNTNIVGPLPQSFGHLPYLANVDLSYNQLSGSLPSFKVSELASLEDLDLSYNQLNGTLPYTIGQFSNLSRLCLSSNKLNGVISEAHLSNLSSLQVLDVAKNSLTFNLSSSWVPPFQLYGLYASSCILGPKFPTWLKHLRGLVGLEISNGGISDSFPEWFWDISSSLSYLNVSRNKFSGALPKSFPSMKRLDLDTWDFSFNNLSGPLPPFPELYGLFLSNNNFSGLLSSFCATSPLDLTYLDLSSNLLVGSLLDCWGKFQSLQVLNLEKNNLSGKIPKSFGTLREMASMHLNNNNFSGEIPSLILCSSLAFIDFGDNNLQGTLPPWIGHNLHQLIVLRLRANKFQGNIPTSLCNLLSLQVLDLSNNNITGEIPQCLNHINALSDKKFPRKPISYGPYLNSIDDYKIGFTIDRAILAWKGENREYGKNLRFMTTIDLSCNHLTGEIPQTMTKLVVLAGLNLSGNNLTGLIPNNIGHMKMLESLDLSRNHLCGRMPESFSNLTFLSYMNLSFNNLSGKIPSGTQLQSFNASAYEGNSGLCGPPLTNHCLGDAISPNGSLGKHVTNEDEDELITLGFYISLGLGFFVGFWGVCGTLVIKTYWRQAYFQFFNNINDWIHVTLLIFTVRMKRRFQVQD